MESTQPGTSPTGAGSELSHQLESALEHARAWLHQRQLPTGEFPVSYIRHVEGRQETKKDSCIFPTALVADCLLTLPDHPQTEEMLARATRFLLEEIHRDGLWSHFPRTHWLRGLCGPDADDTACVSAVLRARGLTGPLQQNVRLLLANRNSQGLFYTWFVTRFCWSLDPLYWRVVLSEWRHPRTTLLYWLGGEPVRNGVDGVVNANVLYYLGDIPETQPVVDYLLRIIASGTETRCDFWYHAPNIIYYFVARNFSRGIPRLEPARQPIIDRIRATAQPDGRLGETVLETAMGACALLHLGVPAPELIPTVQFLLEARLAEGQWPLAALYYGGPAKRIAWGSEELTTAFCLEALARFRTSLAAEGKN